MTFAQALKSEMDRENLSHTALAKELNVSQPTVSAWLNGAEPRLRYCAMLLRRFPALISLALTAEISR